MSGLWSAWVTEHLDQGHWEAANEWLTYCLFHGDRHPSMAVNTEKGVFNCRSCGERGTIGRLARQLQLPQPTFTVEMVAHMVRQAKTEAEAQAWGQVLPESWLLQFRHDHPYWESRLEPATIEYFGLGYDPLTDAATIPLRRPDGKLLGVTRRYLAPGAQPKYRHPTGVPRGGMLFGAHAVPAWPEELVVCEGMVDAMAVWETGTPAVAIMTNQVSEVQALWIRRIEPQVVVVGLDNDPRGQGKPGRMRHGKWQKGSGVWSLLEAITDVKVTIVQWSAKDPADLPIAIRRSDLEFQLPADVWKVEHHPMSPHNIV